MKTKLSLILSLFFAFLQSQAGVGTNYAPLSDYADPTVGYSMYINDLTYNATLQGVVVTGLFSGFLKHTGTYRNVALVKNNGEIIPIGNGIDTTGIASLQTSDGTSWLLTITGLYKLDSTGAYKKTTFASSANNAFFEGENDCLIILTNTTALNGAEYAVRFYPATETTDTFGLTLPARYDTSWNWTPIVKTTKDGAAYFNWNTDGSEGGLLFKYDTTLRQIIQVTSAPASFYNRALGYDSVNQVLYYYGLFGNRYLYSYNLLTEQWNQVLTFDEDVLTLVVRQGTLYISGGFNYVDGQTIPYNATFDIANSTFSAWDPGMGYSLSQICFFDNGKILGSTYWTLVSNFTVTDVPSISKSNIAMYPNPASDYITFSNLPNATAIVITNILGQQVEKITTVGTTTVANISSFEQGVYFATDENGLIGRFIKK